MICITGISKKFTFFAYINNYRVYGNKPWGFCDIDLEIIAPGNKTVDIEVWRTKQKNGRWIRFAYKVNGKPCNPKSLSDYVFKAPEEDRVLVDSFSVGLSQVPPEHKHRFNKPTKSLRHGVDLFYIK